MNAATEMESPLIFTDSAANKVKSLIDEEGNPDLKLRVFVSGGGCSGFQYGFTFDEAQNADDTVMVKNGVTLLVDSNDRNVLASLVTKLKTYQITATVSPYTEEK